MIETMCVSIHCMCDEEDTIFHCAMSNQLKSHDMECISMTF